MEKQTKEQIDILSQIIDLAFLLDDQQTRMLIAIKAIDLRAALQTKDNA